MEKRNLVCICCPMGCRMEVTLDGGKVIEVTGNTCKRGYNYAVDECTNPKRTITTTVRTAKGAVLPVKTAEAIPFGKMTEAMGEISRVVAPTPVKIGDVVLRNVCGTGIDVVATRNAD